MKSRLDGPDAFNRIVKQIEEAGLKPPPAPQKVVAAGKDFDLCVLLLPDVNHGGLETLCVTAALSKWAVLSQPLSTYKAATAAHGWSPGKQSKMEIQCILAATCEPKPDTTLKWTWQQDEQYHIPLNHAVFDPIATFLGGL